MPVARPLTSATNSCSPGRRCSNCIHSTHSSVAPNWYPIIIVTTIGSPPPELELCISHAMTHAGCRFIYNMRCWFRMFVVHTPHCLSRVLAVLLATREHMQCCLAWLCVGMIASLAVHAPICVVGYGLAVASLTHHGQGQSRHPHFCWFSTLIACHVHITWLLHQ